MFYPVVIKANNLGISAKVEDIRVISKLDNVYVIPFQIDEVKDGSYFDGDGIFSGDDEIVFFSDYCGDKLSKDEIPAEDVFEFKSDGKFCYIVKKLKVNFPEIKDEFLSSENSTSDFIVKSLGRVAIFDNLKPLVKEIRIEVDGEFKKVFSGMFADIEMDLLNLIKIKKTEKDLGSKVVFLKSGKIRIIRVVKPYLDIFAGIKIPTSSSTTLIYPGYTILFNSVKIPFKASAVSRSAFGIVYLRFISPKKIVSRDNFIVIGDSRRISDEDGHSWCYIEGDGWGAYYFIKEITKIPIKRNFYFRNNGDSVDVGIKLDLLTLPRGEHKFALYGFFFPPGNMEEAKKILNPPKFELRRVLDH